MPTVEISYGELLDRYSIAVVKVRNLQGDNQLQAKAEADRLSRLASPLITDPIIGPLYQKLETANINMWDSMEAIYQWTGERDAAFNSLVLQIVERNKDRALAKRAIDFALDSSIREAKSFF